MRMPSAANHKDLILDIVPTPLQDDVFTSSASTAKSLKSKSVSSSANYDSVVVKVDTTWAVEHATQVDSMLPGGVQILGYYFYCSEKTFKNTKTSMQVTTCLRNLERALKMKVPPVVLHVDATSRKTSAKSLNGDSLKTLELKFTKIENNLVRVQSVFATSAAPTIVVGATGGAKAAKMGLVKELDRWREREARRLDRMALKVAAGSGAFVDADADVQVINLLKGAGSDHRDAQSKIGLRNLDLDIFCPFLTPAQGGLPRVYGRVQSTGTIKCIGYVYARDSAARILEALRMDLVRSMQTRIDVYVEEALEAEQQMGDEGNGEDEDEDAMAMHPLIEAQRDGASGLATPIAIALPARKVFVRDVTSTGAMDFELAFSHYTTTEEEEEAAAECVSHLEDLLVTTGFAHFDADASEAGAEDEDEEVPMWDPMASPTSEGGGGSGKGDKPVKAAEKASGGGGGATAAGQTNPVHLVGALLALFLALLAYLLLS